MHSEVEDFTMENLDKEVHQIGSQRVENGLGGDSTTLPVDQMREKRKFVNLFFIPLVMIQLNTLEVQMLKINTSIRT